MKKRALYIFPGESIVFGGAKRKVLSRVSNKAKVLSRDLWIGFVFDSSREPIWFRYHEDVECVK